MRNPHAFLQRSFLLLLVFLPAPVAGALALQEGPTDDPFPQVDPEDIHDPAALELLADFVRGLVDDEVLVGAELHVIQDRQTLLHRAFGWADRDDMRPMELDAIFCVRSMTKPMGGTAVQMLLDDDELTLDTRAAEILPSFEGPQTSEITIDHLLTHTGGFPFNTIKKPLTSYGSIADVAAEAAEHGVGFKPGTRFEYSDAGADTLGAIVQEVSGQPIEAFMQERILDPLGMSESILLLDAEDPRRSRIPSAYSGGTGSWERHWGPDDDPMFSLFLTSQGLYCTTTDYARLLALWMDYGLAGDQRLLSEEAIERGLEPRNSMGPSRGFADLQQFYGQQWVVWTDADKSLVLFGHDGSDGTFAWAWPDEDLVVLLFTQSRMTRAGAGVERVIHQLLIDGDVEGRRQDVLVAEAQVAALQGFTGRYWAEASPRNYFEVRTVGRRLTLERPGSFIRNLEPTEELGRFMMEGSDNAVSFELNPDGGSPGMFLPTPRGPQRIVRYSAPAGLPDAEAVLALVRDAHGIDHLDELGGVRLTGTVEWPQRKLSGTIELLLDGRRLRRTMNLGGGDSVATLTADGTVTVKEPGVDVTLEDKESVLNVHLLHPLHQFGGWAALGRSVEVIGQFAKGDESYLILRTESEGAHGSTKIVDATTGRLLMEDRLEKIPGIGVVGQKIEYSDFREIEGLTIPMQTKTRYSFHILGDVIVKYDAVETGIDLDAELTAGGAGGE